MFLPIAFFLLAHLYGELREWATEHLYGLNLSRAWMLLALAHSLPASDPRGPALMAAARVHRTAGMTGVTGEHYEGSHWLGTFAVYLESGRGLPAPGRRP